MLLKIPTWWGMALGISFGSFGNYAISTWVIDYYVRAFAGLDITQLLIVFGIINGTAYALGVWLGGYIADRWGKHNKKAYALLPAIAYCWCWHFIHRCKCKIVVVSGLMALLLFWWFIPGPSFAMARH